MRRARQILAVTLVATAICADRAVAAAPSVNGGGAPSDARVTSMASRIVRGFSSSFRRAVSAVRLHETRRDTSAAVRPELAPDAPLAVHPTLEPFRFRLPPPVC